MRLVFLDAEREVIRILDRDEVHEFDWEDEDEFAHLLRGQSVYYVRSLDEVEGSDIIDAIAQLTNRTQRPSSGRKYLRLAKGGALYVPGLTEGNSLMFEDNRDFKHFSGESMLDEYPNLKNLIKRGVIEIVDEHYMRKLRKKIDKKKTLEEKKRRSAKDKYLDSIIVDSPRAADYVDNIRSIGYGDDENLIDITDDIQNSISDEPEYIRAARAAGIDIDNIDDMD